MSFLDIFRSKPQKSIRKPVSAEEIEREMYEKNIGGYRDAKDSLDYQNALLDRVNAARERFKADGDLDAVIAELEFAFIESDPPCNTSQNLSLVDYYIKADKRDKAWGYLNMLLSKQQAPLEKIRFAQARILKLEKKYLDAIEMYALGHLAKSEWNNTFNESMFLKDIQSSANKLGWDDEARNHISGMIKVAVNHRDYRESELLKQYRHFIESTLSKMEKTK